jgi:hypothetical protein
VADSDGDAGLAGDVRRAVREGREDSQVVVPGDGPADCGCVAAGHREDSAKQEPTGHWTLAARASRCHFRACTGRNRDTVRYRRKRLDAWRSLWSSCSCRPPRTRKSSQAARTPVPLQRALRFGADVNGRQPQRQGPGRDRRLPPRQAAPRPDCDHESSEAERRSDKSDLRSLERDDKGDVSPATPRVRQPRARKGRDAARPVDGDGPLVSGDHSGCVCPPVRA